MLANYQEEKLKDVRSGLPPRMGRCLLPFDINPSELFNFYIMGMYHFDKNLKQPAFLAHHIKKTTLAIVLEGHKHI